MAKKGGGTAPHYTGGGGRVFASPAYSNEDGFGTPPAPGRRGEAEGSPIKTGLGKPPGAANIIGKFRSKKGR